jgi:hypothetical protein
LTDLRELGVGRQTAAVEQPRINSQRRECRGSKIGTAYNELGKDLLLIQMRQEPGLQTDTDDQQAKGNRRFLRKAMETPGRGVRSLVQEVSALDRQNSIR